MIKNLNRSGIAVVAISFGKSKKMAKDAWFFDPMAGTIPDHRVLAHEMGSSSGLLAGTVRIVTWSEKEPREYEVEGQTFIAHDFKYVFGSLKSGSIKELKEDISEIGAGKLIPIAPAELVSGTDNKGNKGGAPEVTNETPAERKKRIKAEAAALALEESAGK